MKASGRAVRGGTVLLWTALRPDNSGVDGQAAPTSTISEKESHGPNRKMQNLRYTTDSTDW